MGSNLPREPISPVCYLQFYTNLFKLVPIEKAHKYDIGLYVSKIESMSEEDVYDLIKNVWVPPDDYEFPYTNLANLVKISYGYFHIFAIPSISMVEKFVHCSA